MTALEMRVLAYISGRCEASSPPMRNHIARYFEPEATHHVVNALWSRGMIKRPTWGRKGAPRPFLITDAGRRFLAAQKEMANG